MLDNCATVYRYRGEPLRMSYSQAAPILEILNGEREAKPEQVAFMENVRAVEFDKLPNLTRPVPKNTTEHDTKMDEIYANDKLKGHDMFKAVCDRIKERIGL